MIQPALVLGSIFQLDPVVWYTPRQWIAAKPILTAQLAPRDTSRPALCKACIMQSDSAFPSIHRKEAGAKERSLKMLPDDRGPCPCPCPCNAASNACANEAMMPTYTARNVDQRWNLML